ncbi:MAG: MBL fold metallo-hydrolase [Saprospiraceae bacterium]
MNELSLRLLGTGTSQGVPVIGCDCAVCTSTDPRDRRLRTSALVRRGATNLVIDTGPDFREQMLAARPDSLTGVLYTHEHADHVAGLDDVRPFVFRQRSSVDLYGNERTLGEIRRRFDYAFSPNPYPGAPRLNTHILHPGRAARLGEIEFTPLALFHGDLPILGYHFGDIAYLTDVKTLPPATYEALRGIDTLVLDALHHYPHHSHLNLEEALAEVEKIKPRRTVFVHASHYMGRYAEVQAGLPPGVELGYDGMTLKAGE